MTASEDIPTRQTPDHAPPSHNVRAPRTRLNVKQSKVGCFTCRARRKKCGEEKPTCFRCENSGLTCEGYPSRAQPAHFRNGGGPKTDPALLVIISQRHVHFHRLAFELLSCEASDDAFGVGGAVWTSTLFQLSMLNTTIHTAMVCLGASYEALMIRKDSGFDADRLGFGIKYQNALSALRLEVSGPGHDTVAIFLSCLILAAVEVLQRDLTNALVHLQGAFTVLAIHGPEFVDSNQQDDNWHKLQMIARALDCEVAAYALKRPLEMTPITSPRIDSLDWFRHDLSMDRITPNIVPLLHCCYHFASWANAFKYSAPSKVPHTVVLEQTRLISLLSQVLTTLHHNQSHCRSSQKGRYQRISRSSYLIMRIQCLSILIYLSALLSAAEWAYDCYQPWFYQIVDAASEALDRTSDHRSRLPRFRFISPLSQPLYLTAMKCRNPLLRRKAIDLLARTGKEGPWDSVMHVVVARRAVEIEEGCSWGAVSQVSERIVPERDRLHGCGLNTDRDRFKDAATIEVFFSQCRDVERMVYDPDTSWESEVHWQMWREELTCG